MGKGLKPKRQKTPLSFSQLKSWTIQKEAEPISYDNHLIRRDDFYIPY